MADDEVTPLTTTTTNYGWVKPDVGASDDVWGGMLNADLDNIDSTIKGVSNVANAAYPATNPSGYQTAAQVTAAVPVASSTTPIVNGTAAVGTGTTWARADHVHPTDTSGWLGDNRLINGDMRIDQRNNGASGTAIGYTVDRWNFAAGLATKGTWGRNLNAVAGPSGFPYYLGFQSNSAYSPAAGDYFMFSQALEGDAISDLAWGTANAQPVTVSFLAYSSLTGTFSASLANYAGTRSYPFSYTIPTASTWTKIVITIPGDATGTWVMSGNAGSLGFRFDLGCGANSRGPANAWAAANYVGVTGSASAVGTNGAQFYVTGVKLEIGSVATPYNRQSLAKSMADCQRYFQWAAFNIQFFPTGGSQTFGHTLSFPTMRASPTASATVADPNLSQGIANNGGTAVDTLTPYGARLSMVAIAAAATYALGYRVSLSAEL